GASSTRHAASSSITCAARGNSSSSGNLLWLGGSRPAVYYVDGGKVISSHGRRVSLPAYAIPVGFRACGKPVVLYTVGSVLRASALAGGGQMMTVGRNAVVGARGG